MQVSARYKRQVLPREELERRIAAYDWATIRKAVLALSASPPTPIPVDEIEAFERTYRISLPDDYRRFLLEIGDGAPGPGEGILPFRHGVIEEAVGVPFPGRNTGDDEADDEHNAEIDIVDWHNGVLPIAEFDENGVSYYVVVHGEERGRIWEVDGEYSPAASPLCRPLNFREWYALWLDRQRVAPR